MCETQFKQKRNYNNDNFTKLHFTWWGKAWYIIGKNTLSLKKKCETPFKQKFVEVPAFYKNVKLFYKNVKFTKLRFTWCGGSTLGI